MYTELLQSIFRSRPTFHARAFVCTPRGRPSCGRPGASVAGTLQACPKGRPLPCLRSLASTRARGSAQTSAPALLPPQLWKDGHEPSRGRLQPCPHLKPLPWSSSLTSMATHMSAPALLPGVVPAVEGWARAQQGRLQPCPPRGPLPCPRSLA